MCNWVDVKNELPKMEGRGLPSKPVFAVAQEFGCEPVVLVARFWKSSLPGQEPCWYLDEKTYFLDHPFQVSAPVFLWMDIPSIPENLNFGASQGLFT